MSKTTESKNSSKKQSKGSSVRITGEDAKLLKAIRARIRGKAGVGNVNAGEIVSVALKLVGDVQIRELQEQAVTRDYRKEQLRQKYIALRGPISKKGFDDIMLTPEYAEFLLEQRKLEAVAQISA